MWGLSADSIRRLFDDEPGVLVIGDTNHQHKRRYRTLRIPRSVIERVNIEPIYRLPITSRDPSFGLLYQVVGTSRSGLFRGS
jgi:hypothetical protein